MPSLTLEAAATPGARMVRTAASTAVVIPQGVVIYGASWCDHCKAAKTFYEKTGVPVAYVDIEKSPEREAEMNAKLKRIGRSFSALPVIDDRGKISVGFSPPSTAAPDSPSTMGERKPVPVAAVPFNVVVGIGLGGAGLILGWIAGSFIRRRKQG